MRTDTEVSEREELLESLRDKRRRHHLASVAIKRGLAEQIREMRADRGWTQSDLACATNKVQETISQLENPNYGSYTIKTLERLAVAFDVALVVRFVPFSELVRWMTDLSPEDLAVPDFDHDPGLRDEPRGARSPAPIIELSAFRKPASSRGIRVTQGVLDVRGASVAPSTVRLYSLSTNSQTAVVR